MWSSRPRTLTVVACALVAAGLAGCDSGGPIGTASAGGRLRVVAAENFWGSIASRLGGDRVAVRSIVVNPSADPHSYEPTASDARTIAGARMAIVNGIGYDNWAPRLLEASGGEGDGSDRLVLNVGEALGLKDGDNPHQWYAPASVKKVVAGIVADYDRLDPADAAYFAEREKAFETKSLARYDELRAQIRAKYGGTPVGCSESIFRPLGEDLGLKLETPYGFTKAIAEGTDVTAQDKRTVDEQAADRRVKVWVFNSQNVTPDVRRVNEIARARGIPIVTVTETLSPASDTFEQWQVAQLEGLLRALGEARRR